MDSGDAVCGVPWSQDVNTGGRHRATRGERSVRSRVLSREYQTRPVYSLIKMIVLIFLVAAREKLRVDESGLPKFVWGAHIVLFSH